MKGSIEDSRNGPHVTKIQSETEGPQDGIRPNSQPRAAVRPKTVRKVREQIKEKKLQKKLSMIEIGKSMRKRTIGLSLSGIMSRMRGDRSSHSPDVDKS